MMKRAFLLFPLLFMFFEPLQALPDRPKKNMIGLQTGALSSLVKDELASPLRYKGSGSVVQLTYHHEGLRGRHSFRLSYSKFDLQPTAELSFGRHFLNNVQAAASYGYHRYAGSFFGDRLKLYLGGVWDNHASSRELYYLNNMSETSWEFFSSLNVSPLLEWRLSSKLRFVHESAVSLAAFVERPPYGMKGIVNRRVVTLGRFIRLKNHLTMEHELSPRILARLTYAYSFYRYPEPQTVKSGADLYMAALAYRF